MQPYSTNYSQPPAVTRTPSNENALRLHGIDTARDGARWQSPIQANTVPTPRPEDNVSPEQRQQQAEAERLKIAREAEQIAAKHDGQRQRDQADEDDTEASRRLLDVVKNSGHTHHVQAIVKKELELVPLPGSADVNFQDAQGHFALWHAAKLGNGPLCNLLLKSKANPNLKTRTGSTALHEAVYFDNGTVVGILLSHGADTSAKGGPVSSFSGITPLQLAKERGHEDIAKKIAKYDEGDARVDARQGEYGASSARSSRLPRPAQPLPPFTATNVPDISDGGPPQVALSLAAVDEAAAAARGGGGRVPAPVPTLPLQSELERSPNAGPMTPRSVEVCLARAEKYRKGQRLVQKLAGLRASTDDEVIDQEAEELTRQDHAEYLEHLRKAFADARAVRHDVPASKYTFKAATIEVLEYADYLGMSIEDGSDLHLLWIADEALQMDEPHDWDARKGPDEREYYQHRATGQIIYEHPHDFTTQQKYFDALKAEGRKVPETPRPTADHAATQVDEPDRKLASESPLMRSSHRSAQSTAPPDSPTEDAWADLVELLRGLNLQDDKCRAATTAAITFCKDQGADNLAEMAEAELLDELVRHLGSDDLGLGRAKLNILAKRLAQLGAASEGIRI